MAASVRVELTGVKTKPNQTDQGEVALSLPIVVRAESSRYMFDQESYKRCVGVVWWQRGKGGSRCSPKQVVRVGTVACAAPRHDFIMNPRVASVSFIPGLSGNDIQPANFDSTSESIPTTTCNFTPLDPASTGRFVNSLPLLGTWTVDWAEGGSLDNLPFDFSGLEAIKISFPDVSAASVLGWPAPTLGMHAWWLYTTCPLLA